MRRIIAMLLAVVLLVGNVPVQAFATEDAQQETLPCATEGCTYGADHEGNCSNYVAPEGCEVEGCTYAAGHEGNCSNYVAPEACEVEGCTYGAGHAGNCSTFVACGKDGCTYAAGHVGNCSSYVAPKAEPAPDAPVFVTVSDRGELAMGYEEVTVSDLDQDGKLTVAEALKAAHEVYGKDCAWENGTVTKLWDVETGNVSFFVNHTQVYGDICQETVTSGDYLVASVDQDDVNDYDKYSRFDILETDVKTGEAITLTLTDDMDNALAGMEIGLSDGNGTTTMTALTTDEAGSVTLTLDQEGLFFITARGTVAESAIDMTTQEIITMEAPIVAPVCVATVSGTTEQEPIIWSGDQDSRSVENENLSAEVTVTISDDQGNLVLVRENVTAVDTDEDGVLTFHDAMVVVHDNHKKAYKIQENEGTVVVDMLWDITAGASLFFINDRPLASGVNIDTIQTGDTLHAALLRDTNNYSDWYTFFTEDAVTVEAGEKFTLTLQGFSGMAYGEIRPVPLERMAIGIPVYGFGMGKTDENGQVTLSFDEKGTYTVSADGSVYAFDGSGKEMECLIVPPVCVVTVTEPSVAVDKVTLDQTALTMTVGDSTQLNVEVGPENATDKTVTWNTSDPFVATAGGGLVTAIGAGTATITATAGNESAECIVTVSAPAVESGSVTIELDEKANQKFLVKSFEISGAAVTKTETSDTSFTSLYNHKATIDVTLSQMPAGPLDLTMTMMRDGQAWLSVNSETPKECETPYTFQADLAKGVFSYTIVTYGNKQLRNIGGTYTINFYIDGVDTNIAPALKDNVESEVSASRYTGQTYTLDLKSLFTDGNNDALTYTVQIGDQEPVEADANYSFAATTEGNYILVFRASDGKETSQDCYTVHLDVAVNTAPYLTGGSTETDVVDQYSTWKIDLGKIFADNEGNGVTYTVSVNDGDPVNVSQEYSYTPETADDVILVFQAQDNAGAKSEVYTMTLTVNPIFRTTIDSNCIGTENGDTWVKQITVTGAEVVRSKWNAETGHTESEEHILNIQLSKDTPADAEIELSYTPGYVHNSFAGSVSGPASVTLADGQATATVTTSGWMSKGVPRTYTLQFTNKANSAPVAAADPEPKDMSVGDELKIKLSEIFSDADGDELRYTLTLGEEVTEVQADFIRTISTSGNQQFVFTAYDVWKESATYTVTVNAALSQNTYDVVFQIPEGITPSFYVTGNFDEENGDTLGDALTATAGETAKGFTAYTVAVPETVSRISFRGTGADDKNWGGMSVAVSADMEPVTVIQLNAVIPSKVNDSYVTANQALFQMEDKDGFYAVSGGAGTGDYGIVNYRFLIAAWGTDDLEKAYTAYVQPLGELVETYATTVGIQKTFEKEDPQQMTQLTMTPKSSFTINAPSGATVQAFQQKKNYNSPETPVTSKLEKDDGTVDWVFQKGDSSRMTYRVSMPGKITKAGYVKGDSLTVSWDSSDSLPNCRDAYDTSTVYGSRGDDSLMLNVNKRNNLVLNSGDSFRLRAYRIWEVVNSDTQNVMIQPDMTYTLSGDDILTVTPVTSGNGNGKNNWLDLTASGTGTAYLEVSYDAMQILTGNMSGFGGEYISGFVFNACDKDRTGLVVVQVGNAAADVDFGIRCTSKINNKDVPWDAEFDTLYFTGSSGTLTLAPTVSSGAIASVEVSGDKGGTWTTLTETDGVYTAEIVPGNNILRITKNDGTQAYQVVRGDKVTVSITEKDGDKDNIVEAGKSYRIQLHGLHNPIGKMAGNYNPGYQAGQHLSYNFNDTTVTTTANYQYDFVSNAWVDVTIPEDAEEGAEFLLKGGNIFFNILGIGDVDDDTKNHRSLTDDGCTTRESGGSNHQRSILPEITLTVGSTTGGTPPAVAVESISLNETELTLAAGESGTLTATVLPVNATDRSVTWTSNNEEAATVSGDGKVTAVAEGEATITATTVNGLAATCKVTVTASQTQGPELDFGLEESDIFGYVKVSFVDNGIRVESELANIDEQYQKPLGVIVEEIQVPFKPYDTIAGVTLRLLNALKIDSAHSGNAISGFYLSGIGNFTVGQTRYEHLSEMDAGSRSGWMVTQNGNFINRGASEFTVKNGDVIKWQYTCQLGEDIGDMTSKEAVEAVENLISAIGTVDLSKKQQIEAARAAYEKLQPIQQKSVSNYKLLTDAEAALAEQEATEADKAAARAVMDQITAIGTVTKDSKAAIEAARTAYKALTDAQKRMVTNYSVLVEAEETLELLNRVPANIVSIYQATGDQLAGKKLTLGQTNGDWVALGLARSGRTVAADYYKEVEKAVTGNRLNTAKATENARVILALTAIGKDVTNVNGHNLLAGLNEMSYITKQGINGAFYTLLALNSHGYTPVGDVTCNELVQTILNAQLSDGGWALGRVSEADMTAMAIQALAPYYTTNASVKAAVDRALTWLATAQMKDGSFGSDDGSCAESTAQVIVALTALGIDPDTDTRFIKNGITTVQALANFYTGSGGFRHIAGGSQDAMATEQSYYALAAYIRFENKQTALYDMSDVKLDKDAVAEVENLINAIEDSVEAARAAYDKLTDTQKAMLSPAVLQKLLDAEKAQAEQEKTPEDEIAANKVKALIDALATVDLTRADDVEAARAAYNRLSPRQQNLVNATHLAKLEKAEAELAKLQQEKNDQEAVDRVINLINRIPSGTIATGHQTVIEAARKAYNELNSDALREKVTNRDKLFTAETRLSALLSTESVTFSLLGCYKHGDGETSVHTLSGGNLQTWIPAKTYKIKPGSTVKDLFEQALKAAGLSWYISGGNYVESITYHGQTIGEFTNGTYSGWMYTLNGKHSNEGVGQQELVDGDVVVFHYTDDYTLEDDSVTGSTAKTTTNDTAASKSVERLIGAIGEEITLDSEAKILAARAAYDKLTEAQKKLVKNYDTLVEAEAALAQLKGVSTKDVYTETGDYLESLGIPDVGAVGGEWIVLGLARSGRTVPEGYYDNVLRYVKENINARGQLHSAKSSENSRLILALTALGKDVTNVDGHDLLMGLNDMDHIQKQGINGPIWALLAFDSGNYPVPEGNVSRAALIDVILEAQLEDGGWALSGERSDPDMTGMAIQVLAPYMESDMDVKKAVEEAIWTLSEMQKDNGSFSSVDGANCESIAQVIVALAALGIDADTDARFVKNGISALDALLTYAIPGGGFRHVLDGKLDGMATEQAYYALTAYYRMQQNKTFLYDMTDVIDRGGDPIREEEASEPTEAAGESFEPAGTEKKAGGSKVLIWIGVMGVCAVLITAVLLLRRKLFDKFQ